MHLVRGGILLLVFVTMPAVVVKGLAEWTAGVGANSPVAALAGMAIGAM